jgi:hypothetical protein
MDRVREALRLLLEHARGRGERHAHGHLLPGAGDRLELKITLPLNAEDDGPAIDDAARDVTAALDEAVLELLAHAAVFQPGRILCLRCRRADCEHAAPPDGRSVFAGYGPTGTPRWIDFGQMLLDRHDPRVEQLYAEDNHQLLTAVSTEEDLVRELLPSFRDQRDYRIHGQVAAGWYRVADVTGRRQALAISVQAISTQPSGSRRRFGINVLGGGLAGESLEKLHDRLGLIPWSAGVRWGQSVLHRIAEEDLGQGRGAAAARDRRIEGLLAGLARRLAHTHRARDRRTSHAEERHESGSRPTRMAILDLSRAEDRAILVDTRRNTVVVLGERGRAHVFNDNGKLVTSVRYPPHTIAHRQEAGIWRPATPDEAAALRSRITSDIDGQ